MKKKYIASFKEFKTLKFKRKLVVSTREIAEFQEQDGLKVGI